MQRTLALLALMIAFFQPVSQTGAAQAGWIVLAPGIDFQQFHLITSRPINIFVTRLDRNEPSAMIESAIAQGELINGREKTSEMAARYDQTINYWGETWGNRTRVVAAINGYFFKLDSGRPLSGQIQSGWYVQRFSDYVGDAGFAWNLNRVPYIGKCVFHAPRDQFLTILRSGETRKIDGVNRQRSPDELILYTSHYNSSTDTDKTGVEVLVEMSRPALILPNPARALGQVVKIRDFQGDTPIPFDHVVISATGVKRDGLLARVQVGDEIGISQEISNCSGSPQIDWTKAYAAIGGDNHFLTAGSLSVDTSNGDATLPNSRTAVAYGGSYVYFIVVDGWNLGVSEGIKVRELGEFARDTLGATDAVTLDSGGSSTMVIFGKVVNNAYCNFTRECGMGAEQNPTNILPRRQVKYPELEALVGNALMMAVAEPKVQVERINPGQKVLTSLPTDLRLGPGTNYAVLANIPPGSLGHAQGMHYTDLNGVLAKGWFWQRVEFGDLSGWARLDALTLAPPEGNWRWYLPLVKR
jgi:Phosphodiester glycosidase